MKRLNVYPLFDIEPVKGQGAYVYDSQGNKYLDFYGGHGVISIGHNHPHYNQRVTQQLKTLPFYSNSVINSPQDQLAEKLGEVSGLVEYSLFMVNSGTEANEAALKIAAGVTGRKKIIALKNAFHGRTALSVVVTDRDNYHTPMNDVSLVKRVPINDVDAVKEHLDGEVAAIIIEGIQGIAGIYENDDSYLEEIGRLAKANGSLLILDEVQSGYGRSGRFFAYQYSGVKPDLVTMAKGMGNGFPIGGVAVSPHLQVPSGILGTTFGGNHLACGAGLAVLEVMEKEQLVMNSERMGLILKNELKTIDEPKEIRGKGLMIGIEFAYPIKEIRTQLLKKHRIFTGNAFQANTIRLLPPLGIGEKEVTYFVDSLKNVLTSKNETVYLS